jgi:hypothetical protein
MRIHGLIFVAALAFPGVAAAEMWRVVEGPQGAIKGQWNITISGSTVSGDATMDAPPGGRLTYSVVGSLKDGRLILKRANPSNGVGCEYVATIASEGFKGGAVCDGQQGPWIVRRDS